MSAATCAIGVARSRASSTAPAGRTAGIRDSFRGGGQPPQGNCPDYRGKLILSVAEPDLNGDHTRDLIRQILGAIAQYERALIAARMSAGKALKKAKGGYAGGRPQYGYEARDGELAPAAEEQEAIKLARRLRKEGLFLRQIASRLEESGNRPKSDRDGIPLKLPDC